MRFELEIRCRLEKKNFVYGILLELYYFFSYFFKEIFWHERLQFFFHILMIFFEFLGMPKRGFGVDSQHPFLEHPNSQSIKRGPLSRTSHDQFSCRFFIFRASSPPPLFFLLILSYFGVFKILEEGGTNQLSKLLAGQHLQVPNLCLSSHRSSFRGQTTPCGYE